MASAALSGGLGVIVPYGVIRLQNRAGEDNHLKSPLIGYPANSRYTHRSLGAGLAEKFRAEGRRVYACMFRSGDVQNPFALRSDGAFIG